MTTDYRKEILDLLAAGKINAQEAADMLRRSEPDTAVPLDVDIDLDEPKTEADNGGDPAWFRVRVRDLETGQNKVSINIPLRMLKFGLRLGRHFSPELKDLDYEELRTLMADMKRGTLVEVQDEESNEHVQVFID